MRRFLIEICIVLILIILTWAFLFQTFKMHLIPYDFAMWKSKFDIASTRGHNYETIILGDSLSNAGIAPQLIDSNMFNLSLGGSSPVDAFSLFQSYLENHEKPKTVIISFAATSLYPNEVFKHHTLSFSLHSLGYYFQLFKQVDSFPGFYNSSISLPKIIENILNKNDSAELIYLFDMLLSSLGLNNIQLSFNQNIFSSDVLKLNQQIYEQSIKNQGQHLFSQEERSSLIRNPEILPYFISHPLIDKYFKKLIKLCAARDIRVILIQTPTNEIYKNFLTPSYFNHHRAYFNQLIHGEKNMILVDSFPFYPSALFSDPDHVNHLGMIKYSSEVKRILDNLNRDLFKYEN